MTREKEVLSKGFALEETLRAYFLRAGLFVVRGVPFSIEGQELTDVDLWMYEKPTGTSRRIYIVDAKYKQRPKAIERLFWTKGLVAALELDGAYVATTDQRPFLRRLAAKLGLSIIDGLDIKRIQSSAGVAAVERITDEDLVALIQKIDKERRSKEIHNERHEVLSSLSEGFGIGSLVRSLECFARLSKSAIAAHPKSDASEILCRLAYLSAAIAVASLDYLSIAMPFRSAEERREILLSAVRYGALDPADPGGAYGIALGLVRKYAPNGSGTASVIESGIRSDFDAIPAEIVADQAGRLMKDGQLFSVARELESTCYQAIGINFDSLSSTSKGMLGALLDYAGVSRELFAKAIGATQTVSSSLEDIVASALTDGNGDSKQSSIF